MTCQIADTLEQLDDGSAEIVEMTLWDREHREFTYSDDLVVAMFDEWGLDLDRDALADHRGKDCPCWPDDGDDS